MGVFEIITFFALKLFHVFHYMSLNSQNYFAFLNSL